MAEQLKIEILVDASKLTALATASQTTASAVDSLANKFVESGMSAKDAEGALIGLGYSAKQAAATMAQFGSSAAAAAAQTVAATTSVDGLTRAMAASGVRIASAELGMGGLGMAFSRVAGASSTLAPIIAAAFPVLAASALIGALDSMYTKLRALAMQSLDNAAAWEHIDHASNVAFEALDHSIKRADEQIAALTEGRLASLELELKHVGDGAVEMASKMETMFSAMGTQLEKEQTLFEKTKDFFSFFANHGLVLPNQGELAKLFGADLSKTLDTEGLEAGIAKVSNQIRVVNGELGKTPGDKQLREYADQLVKILGLLEARLTLENKEVSVKQLEIQKEEAALLERFYLDGVRFAQEGAKADLEKIERRTRLEEEAQRKLESIERQNAEEAKRDAREAEAEWQRASELRIHLEQEAMATSQRGAEERIRDARAEESARSAGLAPGPIKSIFEAESLKQQAAIAAEAMAEAKSAAADYASQLDIVRDAMAEVNTDSEEGARQFKDLESQMLQLQHLMDSATASADRWGTSLKQISAHQRELGFSIHNIGLASENAAQAGFQSFNSAFIRMVSGGESFARVMQSLWTGMADSFISSILKMFEEWLTRHILMAALDKIFGAGEIVTSKAKILALSGEAGAGGTASMAAAPFPLDLAAPVFGASMAAIAASYAMFEQGGIVPAGLHPGEMVLPKNLSTFVMTAAASAGGMGGQGGPGGRGGDGAISHGNKTMINNVHVELHGASTTPAAIESAVLRALRKRSLSW